MPRGHLMPSLMSPRCARLVPCSAEVSFARSPRSSNSFLERQSFRPQLLRNINYDQRRLPRRQVCPCQATDMKDDRKKYIADSIRGVPDFPIKGINFHDVTTLLLDPQAFKWSIEDFVERYKEQKIDIVAGFEARGFIFGAPIALELGAGFVPLRKPGKLPGETISAEYKLEYGTDKIEMHVGAVKEGQRVLLVDDLIATGGTLAAGISLMEKVGAVVVEAACVIEMPDLKGRAKLGDVPLYAQIEKEGG